MHPMQNKANTVQVNGKDFKKLTQLLLLALITGSVAI